MSTLDLRKCGFGNVLLMSAGHLRHGKRDIFHDDPAKELGILDTSMFNLETDPTTIDPKLNARYCNLTTLFDPEVQKIMRKITRLPKYDDDDIRGGDAGFCFRVRNSDLDGDVEFMNAAAIEAMTRIMTRYAKPFACSNNRQVLEAVRERVPWCTTVACSSWGERNAEDHVAQWYALSRCPIVFHGVGGNGCVTSTFAPTAAVYGGADLVGIDPFGNACYGPGGYHW